MFRPSELAEAIAVFAITATQIRSAAVPQGSHLSTKFYGIHDVVIVVIFYVLGTQLSGAITQLLPLSIATHVLHVYVEKPMNNLGKLVAN
jgi:hypothetical protein